MSVAVRRPDAQGTAYGDYPFRDRLGDLLRYGVGTDRLTEVEAGYVELGVWLVDLLCAGLVVLEPVEPVRLPGGEDSEDCEEAV